MAELVLDFPLASKMAQVFEGKARYRGAFGGRGSSKSWAFARKALQRMIVDQLNGKVCRILCARELQNSLKDSVLQLLIDQIELLKLQRFFEVGESFVRGADGKSEFLFKGLRHNYREIKSTEGIDITWIEEAESVSEESFRVLLPTAIRKPGSEVWLSWNPEDDDSPIQKRFVDNPPADAKIIAINWRDNPWFTEELESLRQEDMRRDPDLYAHIWEGECLTRTDAQVLGGKWRVDTFGMPGEDIDGGPYYGCDWGFASDPLALIRCWIKDNRLYIDYEAGGKGIEIKDTAAEFRKIPGANKHIIRCDSARPDLISAMQLEGLRAVGAEKWPGSIEDGITHLRSYDEIIIHERCVEVAREARLWSYKVDKKTGDVLPAILDANNHWMDGLRYALAPVIRKQRHTGKAVYAGQYSEMTHVSLDDLWPVKGLPIVVGLSLYQTSVCAVVSQMSKRGQLRILEEIVELDMGAAQFARDVLRPILAGKYRGCPYTVVTFLSNRANTVAIDTDSRVVQDELDDIGITVETVDSSLLSRRLEAVRWFLGQMAGVLPAITISPSCRLIKDGMSGGYQYKRLEAHTWTDDVRYSVDPERNQYVLPNEALQYICMWHRSDQTNTGQDNIVVEARNYV